MNVYGKLMKTPAARVVYLQNTVYINLEYLNAHLTIVYLPVQWKKKQLQNWATTAS